MNGPSASLPKNIAPFSGATSAGAPIKSRKPATIAAVIAHIMIIGLLSVQWTPGQRSFDNPPMEVDLVAETAPTSTAPVITPDEPAARLGDEDASDIAASEPASAPPDPTPPVPARKAAVERPAPKAVPKPTPKASRPAASKAPAKATATPKAAPKPATKKATPKAPAAKAGQSPRPTGRLDGLVDGLAKGPSNATQTRGAPAAASSAEVKRSINVAIDGAIQPFWRRNVPSGVDIEQLNVELRINLSRDGRVSSITQRGALRGKTDSNAPQQALFIERAMRSIRQAAPFDLPEEYYDQWKVWDVTFRAKGM